MHPRLTRTPDTKGTTVTPADEITAAAARLRNARPTSTMTTPPAVADLLRAREPLAKWLDSWTSIELRETATMQEDARHALTIARAVLGTPDQQP